MSEDLIKYHARIEAASRDLCKLRDIDPDSIIPLPSPGRTLVAVSGPAWKSVRPEILKCIDLDIVCKKHSLI